MRIGFIADVHVANHKRFGGDSVASINRRCAAVLDVLKRACDRAAALELSMLVVAGDLFDTTRPEPQVIAEVQACFQRAGCLVVLMLGNHEKKSTEEGDHALGPLSKVATILETPSVLLPGGRKDGLQLLVVPFQPGPAKTWLPAELDAMVARLDADDGAAGGAPILSGRHRVLALHLGISDTKTPPWLLNAPDAVTVELLDGLCLKHKIGCVLAGNWHERKLYRRQHLDSGASIMQIGALVPTGFDNPGLDGYGTLAIWEDGVIDYEELAGPRFVKVTTSDQVEAVLAKATELGHMLYLSECAMPDELEERASALSSLVASATIAAAEVIPDGAVASAQVRTAAESARSSASLEEAVNSYIREMPLPEGVDRGEVQAITMRYMSE